MLRNLPESTGEDVVSKVNSVISEGLKLNGIQVRKAVRKKAFRETDFGVVIATCQTKEEKSEIMSTKATLQKSKRYAKVFIEHDRSKEERLNIANLKTLVSTLGDNRLS